MSNSGQHVDRGHPISSALAQLKSALAAVQESPAWSMGGAATREALLDLTQVRSQLEGLEVRVAAHAHRTGAADAVGATSVASWWAHQTRMTPAEAHRIVKHAVAVDERHGPVGGRAERG